MLKFSKIETAKPDNDSALRTSSSKESPMPQLLRAAVTILLATTTAEFHAQDACVLLTRAQVTAAMGTPVHEGKPGQRTCIWQAVKDNSSTYLSLHDNVPTYDRFKASVEKTNHFVPVFGIGDDAFFFFIGFKPTLYVKRGSMVFLLIVRFDDNHLPKQPQTIEKALAAQILAKN
jgi:hypothetical protein